VIRGIFQHRAWSNTRERHGFELQRDRPEFFACRTRDAHDPSGRDHTEWKRSGSASRQRSSHGDTADRHVTHHSNRRGAAAYIGLAASATILLIRALTVGQTWHSDYSLYGQQYGAQQVFGDLVAPTLARNPNAKFVVSPSWANGTDQFLPFFIPRADLSRVNIGLPINWIERRSEVTPDTYFITTRPEFESLDSRARSHAAL